MNIMYHKNMHPITRTTNELVDYFMSYGFEVILLDEIRTIDEEFESVGIYKENPVRDFSRTFYVDQDQVLQAHLSSVRDKVSSMCGKQGLYVIPGRIYRVNRRSVSHNIISHQFEGIMFGKDLTMKKFHGLMADSFKNVCHNENDLMVTVDFTVFTSPTLQYYYRCYLCNGNGCKLCRNKGKITYAAGGIQTNTYDRANNECILSFCISIDRLAMYKYKLDDARCLYK